MSIRVIQPKFSPLDRRSQRRQRSSPRRRTRPCRLLRHKNTRAKAGIRGARPGTAGAGVWRPAGSGKPLQVGPGRVDH
jgi:hypothetical protein